MSARTGRQRIDVNFLKFSYINRNKWSKGIIPEGLAHTLDYYRKVGNQMGMSSEELQDTCEWMAEEGADEVRGLEIPIDKKGAKYMYTINPREPKYYPLDLAMAAQIFTVVGESWTIPTTGWDCTNLPMFAGDRSLAGQVVQNMYDKAVELGVEKTLLIECGHAFRSAAFEGPYFAGYPDGRPPVEVVHYAQLFYEYLCPLFYF